MKPKLKPEAPQETLPERLAAHVAQERARDAAAHARAEEIVGTCPIGEKLAECPLSLAVHDRGEQVTCGKCGLGKVAEGSHQESGD